MKYSNVEKKIKIISIDAANKSLAIACIEMHVYDADKVLDQLCKVTMPEVFTIMGDYIDNIHVNKLDVVDLLPGKKLKQTDTIERTNALYVYLTKFTNSISEWIDRDTHLVIEYQMGPNKKSGEVQCQATYHFLPHILPQHIHIIGPSIKNKLSTGDPKSKHNYHIANHRTLYCANKSHTRYIFLEWLAQHDQLDKLSKIKRKNYSDIADAFCQAVAWFKLNY